MKVLLLVVLGVCLLFSVNGQQSISRFDGEPVITVNITSQEQVHYLKYMLDASLSDRPIFDIWSRESALVVGLNDIQIHAPVKPTLEKLDILGLKYSYMIQDVQALIDAQDAERNLKLAEKRNLTASPDWFKTYHTYESIVNEARAICQQHSSLCTMNPRIATSIAGRSIIALHLHGGPGPGAKFKIWINGGQHAREWIGPAVVMYILDQLLLGYGTNPTVTKLLNEIEFVIVPVVNPDGYDFTWTNNRLWRKNRRNNGGNVFGVDLNRNWDDHWGGEGSSGVPSSDTYRGTSPFSEPESLGVANYYLNNVKTTGSTVLFAIDYHSYSQLVLCPYGWTTAPPPNKATLASMGSGIVSTIRATSGLTYVSQGSWELYFTSGGATDWFYSKGLVPLSYTIELRDTGQYGFLLPEAQIIPCSTENWNAFIWLAGQALGAAQ